MSTERALTVDEFERIAPFIDGRSELVDGRLRVMMAEKARDWLAAGAREVWLVDGQHETVRVLREGRQLVVLTKNDTLTSPEMLPDFSLPLADLFARRRRSAHAQP